LSRDRHHARSLERCFRNTGRIPSSGTGFRGDIFIAPS
jgi:hypothetical protein